MDMHAEIATIDKQYTSPAACIKAYGRRVAGRDCSRPDRVADGSHPPPAPTERSDFLHYALQTMIHSTAYCFSRV